MMKDCILLNDKVLFVVINIAQRGAVMTLRSKESVSPQLGELKEELDLLAKYSSDSVL